MNSKCFDKASKGFPYLNYTHYSLPLGRSTRSLIRTISFIVVVVSHKSTFSGKSSIGKQSPCPFTVLLDVIPLSYSRQKKSTSIFYFPFFSHVLPSFIFLLPYSFVGETGEKKNFIRCEVLKPCKDLYTLWERYCKNIVGMFLVENNLFVCVRTIRRLFIFLLLFFLD